MQIKIKRVLPDGSVSARAAPPRYPAVDAAIKARGSIKQFCTRAKIHEQTYYLLQSRMSNPTQRIVNAVLDYTGLSYDQAFGSKKE